MKKILSLSALLTLSIFSFAQVNLQSVIKPGTKLIYGVESNGQKYDFIVTVKTLVPTLVFDWEMTNDKKSSGTITHTAQAMISANTMYNYFAPGQKALDDNTISVWLSKNSFTGLTKGTKSVVMSMNVGEAPKNMANFSEDPKELKIIVNGEKETVEELLAKEVNAQGKPKGDDTFFTFSTSAKMPIIIRMKNDFYIALKEIKTK
jgi:hypothetical protein